MPRDRQELVAQPYRLLLAAIEPGVVDRHGRDRRDPLGETQIVLVEAAPRFRGRESERAEHGTPRGERDAHEGGHAQRSNRFQVLRRLRDRREKRVRHLRHELRPTGPDDRRGAHGVVWRGRKEIVQTPRELDLAGVAVRHRDELETPALVEQIDLAPVGDPGNREAGDAPESELLVEGRSEDPTGVGEKPVPLLRAFAFRDVGEHREGAGELPAGPAHRRRRDDRPQERAVPPAEPDVELLGNPPPPPPPPEQPADPLLLLRIEEVEDGMPENAGDGTVEHPRHPLVDVHGVRRRVEPPDPLVRGLENAAVARLALANGLLRSLAFQEIAQLTAEGLDELDYVLVRGPSVGREEFERPEHRPAGPDRRAEARVKARLPRRRQARKVRVVDQVRQPGRPAGLPDPSGQPDAASEPRRAADRLERRGPVGNRGPARGADEDLASRLRRRHDPELPDLPAEGAADRLEDPRSRLLEGRRVREDPRQSVLGVAALLRPLSLRDVPDGAREEHPSLAGHTGDRELDRKFRAVRPHPDDLDPPAQNRSLPRREVPAHSAPVGLAERRGDDDLRHLPAEDVLPGVLEDPLGPAVELDDRSPFVDRD